MEPKVYKPKILMLDIERAPYLGYLWDQGKQYISEAQLIKDSYVLCWQAKWWESGWNHSSLIDDGHESMIKGIYNLIGEADAVVGWNTNGFDLKVLNAEFLKLGMTPPAPYKSVDLLTTSRSQFKFLNNKLDYVARAMGAPYGKLPHDKTLWLRCMGIMHKHKSDPKQAYKEMLRYNKRDVELLDWIFPRFRPYIRNFPNLNLYIPNKDGERHCPKCLSPSLNYYDNRPVLQTARDRYRCRACGAWSYWAPVAKALKAI